MYKLHFKKQVLYLNRITIFLIVINLKINMTSNMY